MQCTLLTIVLCKGFASKEDKYCQLLILHAMHLMLLNVRAHQMIVEEE